MPAQIVEYTISLTVKRAIGGWTTDETAEDLANAAEWMTGRDAKRELEREVLLALRKLDGDCDCEVMETVTKGDI